ncbi:hypothetical protein BHE74_00047368 [Ensete ventricosum]|nr:hypothetical protein BHE74_00047368 [Ensete ventricosum]
MRTHHNEHRRYTTRECQGALLEGVVGSVRDRCKNADEHRWIASRAASRVAAKKPRDTAGKHHGNMRDRCGNAKECNSDTI